MHLAIIDDLEALTKQVKVISVNPRDPVYVCQYPTAWRCIGLGNSAAVFQPKNHLNLSIKVYAEGFGHLAEQEAAVYARLGESRYFSRFFGKGERALYLQYRAGVDIYHCLTQGIFIPEQVISDVEAAIAYARNIGLNPSDIHTRNVLVHRGRGYLIDVSHYLTSEECKRWEHLKQIYFSYYTRYYRPGLAIPPWVLEVIRKWYKSNPGKDLQSFADKILTLLLNSGL